MKKIVFHPHDLFLKEEYRLEKKLGEGGMGQVWKAVELYSGDVVAIKMLHDQGGNFAVRFRQECRFYTKLKHPNIVRMAKAGEDENGVMYIIMEFLEGITCRRVLQINPRLEPIQAAHLGIQLADAGGYMHAKGVWHRDLKPENLMVGTTKEMKGHLWLFDFGIAKFANAQDQGLNTDELPDVMTVRYMAPEQVDIGNRRKVDGRADIYSFGAILYELITGRHIFIRPGEPVTAAQIMHGHLVARIKPIRSLVPDCPEEIEFIVHKCLEKDPTERFQSFDGISDPLRSLIRASSLPPDNYVAKGIMRRRLQVARARAFEEADIGGRGEEPREGGASKGDPRDAADPHARTTVPGRYPGIDLEAAVGEAKDRAAARTQERSAALAPEPPIENASAETRAATLPPEPPVRADENDAPTAGPRVERITEPMAPVFVAPAKVLPFEPPVAPARRGKGYTDPMGMPSAAALLARAAAHRRAPNVPPSVMMPPVGSAWVHEHASTPSSLAANVAAPRPPPTLNDARSLPMPASRLVPTLNDASSPSMRTWAAESSVAPTLEDVTTPASVAAPPSSAPAPSSSAPVDVYARTEPVQRRAPTPPSPLTPIATMTVQPSPSPALPVPTAPIVAPARRSRALARSVTLGLVVGLLCTGMLVAIRYRPAFLSGPPVNASTMPATTATTTPIATAPPTATATAAPMMTAVVTPTATAASAAPAASAPTPRARAAAPSPKPTAPKAAPQPTFQPPFEAPEPRRRGPLIRSEDEEASRPARSPGRTF